MEANKKPRIFLNLLQIRFAITALCSIGHRITGLALIFCIPILLCTLDYSLLGEEQFTKICLALKEQMLLRLFLGLSIAALVYHVLAGLRHLIMDLGWGETYAVAAKTARLVFILWALILILIARYCIYG